jgi:hypothetical protein
MEQYTMDNGQKLVSEKVKAFNYGKMGANTRGTGKMIKQTGMVDLSTLMETATSETG